MSKEKDLKKENSSNDYIDVVSKRFFKGFDNGILKIEAKAESSDEAIQIAYDIFGHKVTTWDFKWD